MKPLRLINQSTKDRAIQLIKKTPDSPVYEMVLRQAESLRSIEQNEKLHAMLGDVADQVLWHGMKFSKEKWKRLCTFAMLREIGEPAELIPALDGHGFDLIYEKTSKMGVKKMAILIEYVYAFGSQNDVRWSDPKDIANYTR